MRLSPSFPLIVIMEALGMWSMLCLGVAYAQERVPSGLELQEAAAYTTVAKPGSEVPKVSFESIDGKTISLGEWRGKVIVLYFFDPEHRHSVIALKNEVQEFVVPYVQHWRNIEIVAIGRGATKENIETIKKEHDLDTSGFHLVADPEHLTYLKFASKFIPRFFIIGKNGKVAFERTGVHEVKGVKGLREALAEQLTTKIKED